MKRGVDTAEEMVMEYSPVRCNYIENIVIEFEELFERKKVIKIAKSEHTFTNRYDRYK